MLLIKPTAKAAFPFKKKTEQAQVIFKQEKPEPKKQEPKKPDFKMSKREQGEPTSVQQSASKSQEPKQAQQDIPKAALSKNYKKGMENQTKEKDQDDSGQVDIPENAIIDKNKQSKKQTIEPQSIPKASELQQPQAVTKNMVVIFPDFIDYKILIKK